MNCDALPVCDGFTQAAEAGPPDASREKRKSGFWSPAYETPASKKGDTSSGMIGKLIRPKSGVPKSGIRNSALPTGIRLPNSRSNTGHDDDPTTWVVGHSSGPNEL